MSEVRKIGRREFLLRTGTAGAGLLLAARLEPVVAAAPSRLQPSVFLAIDDRGEITVWVAKSEMGQGVRTALPMIVAEELAADFSRIRIEPALADPRYGQMRTVGSSSLRTNWEPLRKTGAAAREMLVSAAAARWGVEPQACRAENGFVVGPGARKAGYGSLVGRASRLPVPENPPLRPASDFRIIGKSIRRLDSAEKITGRAVFGIDVVRPGMVFAALARPPVWGAKLGEVSASKARAVPGVRGVVEVPSGVAVLADSTWAAFRGREALRVDWDGGPNAGLDSASVRRSLEEGLGNPTGMAKRVGAGAEALSQASRRVEAIYELPFLAHATLEPMNCTAEVRGRKAEIWAPTQGPQQAQEAVAKALGIDASDVVVHTTLLGGGFGRRAFWDFAVEAAEVARAAGTPVKVTWDREDDLAHDRYRPASLHRLAGGLDEAGRVLCFTHRVSSPSILEQATGQSSFAPGGPPDVVSGVHDLLYEFPAMEVDYALVKTAVPVWYWRSVYPSQTAFANESFLDELALAAHRDPVELRLELLAHDARMTAVVKLAAERSGWGRALPAGRGRGFACHMDALTRVAEVAEVSVRGGRVRVERVVAAVDAGVCVNPEIAAGQIEGGIVFGLSAALYGEMTVERGSVRERSFDDYPLLRIDETPGVEVYFVKSEAPPTGMGEPGVPPVAPAVANAVFAATGKRLRRLPLREVPS
ncbi:MAG TPA: molybdopterin cofactor-binding domain-containing protein [Anaeromyxobacteraceae bacterium]|nr:molybdopterin cofactor-binding domain-containing protein [Anaeromyxobacteraceae bacterium]